MSVLRSSESSVSCVQDQGSRPAGHFPRELFTLLSESGLLGLVYPEEFGGGDQPYEVYLQVLEELAAARLTVGLGVVGLLQPGNAGSETAIDHIEAVGSRSRSCPRSTGAAARR